MKTFNLSKPVGLLLGSAFLWGVSASVFAAGTAPGAPITNQATLNYDVGGTGQSAILSDGDTGTPGVQTTDFVVDRKVDLTVVSNGNTTVLPGSTSQVLAFTLTNTGNDTHNYLLTAVPGVDATEDDFDMSSVQIYVDINNNGLYDSGTDTAYSAATGVGNLLPGPGAGSFVNLLVVSDTPATPANGQTSLYHLVAQATDAGTTTPTVETGGAGGIDRPGVIDNAFADSVAGSAPGDVAFNGTHSVAGTYTVQSAAVTVTKTSAVTDDGFGNGPPNAKAIPGATVTYSIVVDNSGGAVAASNLALTDTLQVADVAFTAGSVAYDAGCTGATSDSFVTPLLTMNVGTVAAGATCTVTFDVTIN
jgi:uncharacterized repeat protein (TIGR01451 family)